MRPSVAVIALSTLAACGGFAYLHANREPAQQASSAAAAPTPGNVVVASAITAASPAPSLPSVSHEATSTPSPVVTSETIAQWINDTESPDAATRATAIAALADAPESQALPVLKSVLETGDPEVDRHIALRSLHALALRSTDPSGRIRDVIRHAIYHGDDDNVTQTAQSLLDDIEAVFAEREHSAN